jgi:hypothetical protein
VFKQQLIYITIHENKIEFCLIRCRTSIATFVIEPQHAELGSHQISYAPIINVIFGRSTLKQHSHHFNKQADFEYYQELVLAENKVLKQSQVFDVLADDSIDARVALKLAELYFEENTEQNHCTLWQTSALLQAGVRSDFV